MNTPRIAARWMVIAGVWCLAAQFAFAGDAWKAAEMDWPHWRGPELNGISREKNLPDSWSPDGENLLWKSEELATRSTPIVMHGKLYTLARHLPGTRQEAEKVICADAATGKILWENVFNVFLSDVPDTRVAWSAVVGDPTVDPKDPTQGNIFALGVCDYFQCINGETGKTIWSHSLSEEYGFLNTYGGRTNYPIITGDLVIVSGVVIGWGERARPMHSFVAFDKRNGQPVWYEGTRPLPDDTTYSSPMLTAVNGEPQMVFGSGDGSVAAFQPQTGKSLWKYNVSMRGINTAPLVVDGVVYAGHSEENLDTNKMGALFALDATKRGDITKDGELWRVTEWFVGKNQPLMVDGRLYVIEDNARLRVVDPKNGEEIATKKLGTMMRSSPLYADGKIYMCTANGRWYIFKPTEDGIEEVHKLRLPSGEESHGSPIVSHGRVYIPTTGALYCIAREDAKPEADSRPEPPAEAAVKDDQAPAHLQVVPVEALLRSGSSREKQAYHVRVYNAKGQLLGLAEDVGLKPEFTISGPGEINADGLYIAPKDEIHEAVTVTAKAGELTGTARIRLVPQFPWSFNFDDGIVPITWVGARYRHIGLDFDLLQKIREQSAEAGDLYIHVMTSFVNGGQPTARFQDSATRQPWTDLLRYMELLDKVTSLEEAKAALDPLLEILKAEKVVESWKWADDENAGLSLTVQRGERQTEGNGVMCKISTIPKGTRSQAWMGPVAFHDYTIQSDVYAMDRGEQRRPDVGLIGQRYTFDMMGASQQLQIRTWPPQLRMAVSVPFEWQAGKWYTMKFKTAVEDGKAVLRGKVWPKGEAEPENWMIEAVDESPNTVGSPGLFGNVKDAEVFYDNLTVTANE